MTSKYTEMKYELTSIMDENGYTGSALYIYEYGLGTARCGMPCEVTSLLY